jgi:hypothetical protein
MDELDRKSANLTAEDPIPGPEARKPYRKPSFRFEQVFETMALQCGKIAGTSAACNSSKMTS